MSTIHLTANDCQTMQRVAIATDRAKTGSLALSCVHIRNRMAEATDGTLALWADLESEDDSVDMLIPTESIKALAKAKHGAKIESDGQSQTVTVGDTTTTFRQPDADFPPLASILKDMEGEEVAAAAHGFTAVNMARIAKAWPKAHLAFAHKARGSFVRTCLNTDNLRGVIMHIPLPRRMTMPLSTEIITIYRDEQPGVEPGWAYRTTIIRDGETHTGPSGSGPIDGPVSAALDVLDAHGVLSDAQTAALADMVDGEGWDRSAVVMDGVGPLWP